MAWYGLWSNPCIADYVEIWVAERMREQFALGVSASKEQDDDLYDNLYDRGMTICMTVCMTEMAITMKQTVMFLLFVHTMR